MTRTVFEKRFAGAAKVLRQKYLLGELVHGTFCDAFGDITKECSCGLRGLFKTLEDYEERVKGRDESTIHPNEPLDESHLWDLPQTLQVEEPDIRDTEGGWKQVPGFVDKNGWRS